MLAAGSSTRLGRPKQMLPFGDGTLLAHVVADAEASALDRVVVVLGRCAPPDGRRRRGGPGRGHASPSPTDRGLLHRRCSPASTRAGDCDAIVLLLGDMPGVDAARSIDPVVAAWRASPTWAAVTRYADGIGHPFVFSADAFPTAARAARRQGGLEDRRPGARASGSRGSRSTHRSRATSTRGTTTSRCAQRFGFAARGRAGHNARRGVRFPPAARCRAKGGRMFPSPFDYVAATRSTRRSRPRREGGDDARFLAGGQSLLPMMKIRLAHPAKLVDINRIPGLDTLERVNGHLRVGALVRHADIAALRPHVRRRRVGRAVDLRSARAQPRHAVRLGRALRSRGRLELGAARHRRRRRSRAAATASGRSRSPTSSSTSSPTRSPTTRWSPRCASRCRPAAPAARTRSSSARSATTRPSRSPRTSSSAADGTIAKAGLALTAVAPGEHQGRRGRGRCSSGSSRATSCSPRPASSRRRRREPRDDVRGIGRVEAQGRARVHAPGARRGRGDRAPREAEDGGSWRSPSRSTAPSTRTTSSRACCSSTSSAPAPALTGTHIGCDTTSCGACTVLLDGTPMKSCTMLAVQADGASVTTVEGLKSDGAPAPDPGRVQGGARPAVRVLHAGDDARRRRALEQNPRPVRRRRALGDLREHLPLHRLHEHRQGHPYGRGRRRRPDALRSVAHDHVDAPSPPTPPGDRRHRPLA